MIIRRASLDNVEKIVDLWIEFMNEHDKTIIKENPLLFDFEKKNLHAYLDKMAKDNEYPGEHSQGPLGSRDAVPSCNAENACPVLSQNILS